MKLICYKCNEEINIKKDKWVKVIDFDKEEKIKELNMHLKCWKDMAKISMQKAFNEKARQIFPMIKNMFGNMGMAQNV